MRLIYSSLFLCFTAVVLVATESPAGIRAQSWENAPKFQAIAAADSYAAQLPPIAAADAGSFQTAEDGTRYLTLRFQSAGAAAVRLHLRDMHIPAGARIFVYGVENGIVTNVAGPYEGAGSSIDADLWTSPVRGSEAVLELQQGEAAIADLPFEIAEIAAVPLNEIRENQPVQAKEMRTSMYRGRPVTHEVVDGLAVLEGDMILGAAWELPPASSNAKSTSRSAIAVTGNSYRWPGGIIPYIIDPAMTGVIRFTQAINHWNTVMAGYVKLVPRTTESAYVNFYRSTSAGTCSSSIGRSGSQQYVSIGDGCGTGQVIHEIGHAFGLFHEQAREDRNSFVTINFCNVQSSGAYNFNQSISNGDDIGAYDYGSIMHYGAWAFTTNGNPTIVTIPAGIPIGQRTALSTGDIAAIRALYPAAPVGATTVTVSLSTNPSGMPYTVDGVAKTAAASFSWKPGTAHTIATANPAPTMGYAYKFQSWSDKGAQAHTFIVPATASSLKATFTVAYQVTAASVGFGTAVITPVSQDSSYTPGAFLTLKATASADSCFTGWTNLMTGTPASTTLLVMRPYTLTANFQTGAVSTIENTVAAAAAGGSYPVSVTAGTACKWTVSNPGAWLRLQTPPPASGPAVLNVTVDPNTTGAPRSATMTIDSRTVSINQGI